MQKSYVSYFFLVLVLYTGCKTSKLATKSTDQNRASIDTLLVDASPKDTITYFITQKGDTLYSLSDSVQLSVNRVKKDTINLRAVGDIMMGTNFPSTSYLPAMEGETLWKEVKPVLQAGDITFGNLEGVILTEGGEQKECKNPKACYLFRTPDYLSYHFKDAGFDLMSTANNHANDFGKTGRLNTQKVLDSLGITHSGSIETPYSVLRRKDITIGFVSMSPNRGTLVFHDTNQAIEIVNKLDSLTDIVVVSLHIGAEGSKNQHITRETEFYFGENRGNVYELSRMLIDTGADVIIGHGPHVVRAVDIYKDRFIAYSLGNFLTYGRFNLRGPNAYAPILELNIDSEGRFIDGQIHSFIQDYSYGPLYDIKSRVSKKIKELTEIDFPESQISIDEKGRITYLHP